MKPSTGRFLLGVCALLGQTPLVAAGKTLSALSLLEAPSPRAAGMAGAASTLSDHGGSLLTNPALLTTLRTSQLNLSHNKGFLDDSFSQLIAVAPSKNGGWGLSAAYYNGGQTTVVDERGSRQATAQQDLVLGAGVSHRFGGLSVGLTGKYFSSELAETDTAQAWAVDAGAYVQLHSRLGAGVSVQNVGPTLQYIDKEVSLPRAAQAGLSYRLIPTGFLTDVYATGAYLDGTAEFRPSIGFETRVGPMQLRAGVGGGRTPSFAVGTGFAISSVELDYSVGLIDSLSSQHRAGLSFRFGEGKQETSKEIFYPLTAPEMQVVEP